MTSVMWLGRAARVAFSRDRKAAVSRLLMSGICGLAISGLFGVETLQHVEKRLLHRIEQKIVSKLTEKQNARLDQFKQRLSDRWVDIRQVWQRHVSRWSARIQPLWRREADQIGTEAAAQQLADLRGGIPEAERATAEASLVDAADTAGGTKVADAAAEQPGQIRFDPRDADRGGAGPGEGNLALRPPEPGTDVGNHPSELPTFPAEVEAVRSLCSRQPDCFANPRRDANLNRAQEQLRLADCCRVVGVGGHGAIPDPLVGASDGISFDAAGLPADGTAIEGTTGERPVVGGGGLPRETQDGSIRALDATRRCDQQCQMYVAMVEAAAHILSDFDQTKHGADNQEGVGQLLPHRAASADRCFGDPWSRADNSGNITLDDDFRQMGCELADNLDASRGDVRAAFALYVKHNHLAPINAAWPGQLLPDPGPPGPEPECKASPPTGGSWGSPLLGDVANSDIRDLVTTADCRTASIPTASLLTVFARTYADWNTEPASILDTNAFDDPAQSLVAAPVPGSANEPQQVAAAAAYNAGFRGSDLLTITALAGSETGWNPGFVGARPDGRRGYGMWDISLISLGTGVNTTAERLLDPLRNANATFAITEPQGDFTGFCSYWSGGRCGSGVAGGTAAPYRDHLGEATEALSDLAMLDQNQGGPGRPVEVSGRSGFDWPLHGPISQDFGCSPYGFEPYDPICPSRHFHTGIDIAAACGTEVRAAEAGTASVRSAPGGYGNYVTIDHGMARMTLYGHLSSFTLGDGPVRKGQLIGREGSSGNSTGCHLHFEVRHAGLPVAPRPLLP